MESGTTCIEIRDEERTQLESLSKEELEQATIEAIREYRRLLASDEIVYDEWRRAAEASELPADQIERMKEDSLRRRNKTLAQQKVLAYMIDLLGYTPKVPSEKRSQASEA